MRERHPPSSLRKTGLCALLFIGLATAVRADDRADPEVGIILDRLRTERRMVLAYLAHDNADLALTAIDRWRSTLRTEGARLLTATRARSDVYPILQALDASLVEAAKTVERDDGARAREIVQAATGPLDAWRHGAGVALFSDCIADLSSHYVALDRYRQAGPDLDDAAARAGVGTAANDVSAAMRRCDAEARDVVRSDPEFRRLADGMSASLAKVPAALDARDPDLLHRLLIELRAFERLLAFRYG